MEQEIKVVLKAELGSFKSDMAQAKSSVKGTTDEIKNSWDSADGSGEKSGNIFKRVWSKIKSSGQDATESMKSGMKGVEGTSNGLSSTLGKVAKVVAGAFAVGKVIDFGKAAVESAASTTAMNAQFKQVFGELQSDAEKAVNGLASEFGMVPNRVKPAYTQLVSQFKGLGMESNAAMQYAATGTRVAADAAAFYDKSMEDAQGSLNSFVKGNYEGGEAIGIFANDAQMAQFAIKSGVVDSEKAWRSLDEATKQATRLEYAQNMQEQAGAAGQAAREADGWENVMGNLKQAWSDFLAIVGAPILTAVSGIVQGITGAFSSLNDKLGGTNSVGEETSGIFSAIGDVIGGAFNKIIEVVPSAISWVSNLFDKIQNSTAFNSLKDVIGQAVEKIKELWNAFKETGILDTVSSALGKIGDALLDINFSQIASDVAKFAQEWSPLLIGLGAGAATFGAISIAVGIWNGVAAIATGITTALGAAIAFITSPVGIVVAAITALVAIGVLLYKNWDTIKAKCSEIWDAVSAKISEVWTAISEFFTGIWESIKEIFSTAMEAISIGLQFAWEVIKGIVETVMTLIGTIIRTYWEIIKSVFETVMNVIKAIIDAVWSAIGDKVIAVMDAISSVISTVWNAISGVVSTVVNAIKTAVGVAWDWISSKTSAIFNAIKSVVSTIWNAIKSVITTVVNNVKSVVSSVWNAISSTTSSIFNSVKSVVSNVWNSIKSAITSVVNSVKEVVSGVWNAISSTTSSVFNSIKNTASSVWNSVKDAMTKPVEAAKNTISGIIDKIKGFFSGIKLSLPSISMPKLPHFSIKGKFSLTPPSVPHLGVDWYETGGIFDGSRNGQVVGLGENHGSEAILPLSKKNKMAPFAKAVASMMPEQDNTGSGEGDTIINMNVASIVVREEADIKKISQGLAEEADRLKKRKGK